MGTADEATAPGELPRRLVFVDVESTGPSPAHHRIMEIGIVRVEDGRVVDTFSALIDPECPVPANIESFTGIGSEMLRGAPRFGDVAELILAKLDGATFVAHNARFDYAFLRRELLRAGIEFAAEVLCTVRLSRRLYPEHTHHNLDAVMERHEIRGFPRHRALGDAQVLEAFWRQLLGRHDLKSLGAAAAGSFLKTPRLPPQLSPHLADELPDGPGVYRYFDEGDALLYVGKSNTLRQRILSQLGEAHAGSRDAELAAKVQRVDWLETSGELGAMLKEQKLLRESAPLFNRKSRPNAASATLRLRSGASGAVDIVMLDELDACQLAETFGLFRSAADARRALSDIAHAKSLCLKVLGLEAGEGSCVALQFGRCKGACTGREPLMLHGARVQMALAALKLKRWPFPGRIALREAAYGREELHVLEHWAYLGSARSEDELTSLSAREPPPFNADVYKLLVRYLSHHTRLDWLPLPSRTH
jgi:DNA polymerase-3 subunit epsilon